MDIDTLKDAFQKLLSYTYFDKNDLKLRHDVATFTQLLNNPEEEKRIFNELLEIADGNNNELLKLLLSKVELSYFPKQVISSIEQTDDKFVTNIPVGTAITDRLLVKSYFPIELMILDTAWLLKYGPTIDNNQSKSSYGNRLDLTLLGNSVRLGNAIFKKYNYQYQSWWENGLRTANKLLKNEQKVFIINFDITNCYHSIDFNFNEFLSNYLTLNPNSDIIADPLTKIICLIYERYWSLVHQSDAQPFQNKNQGKNSMPLSLLSAHILANWYISPLDKYISENYPEICYYGRYVDDCMIVIQADSNIRNALECINEILPGFITADGKDRVFGFTNNIAISGIKHLENFTIQTDKLYVYHFDCQFPQESIERFEEEQKNRSSEFRFLTDDADQENGRGLEFVTLVQSLDSHEDRYRRFDILEENKYKLSVFLAKLNQRLAKYGYNYEHSVEVDKVFKYFHGHLLIKHYLLWEKMFTSFVLSGKIEYVDKFYNRIIKEIESLTITRDLFIIEIEAGLNNIRKSLLKHLNESYLMAKSLHKQDADIETIYIDTFMVRSHFNQFPLQEFTNNYIEDGVRLPITRLEYNPDKLHYQWMPYYVKYYDIVSALMLGKKFTPEIAEF